MNTTNTNVVNVRNSAYDVYIGRANKSIGEKGSFLANPYSVKDHGRSECIMKYAVWFFEKVSSDATFREKVLALKGKTLGCWCKPQDCHGDIIAHYLDDLGTMSAVNTLYFGGDVHIDDGKVKKVPCKVCGAPAGPTELCSGLCDSEYTEVMEAMDELYVEPSFYIEQYAEEHRPTIVRTLRRIGVIA